MRRSSATPIRSIKQSSFRVVLAKAGQGAGMDLTRKPDRVVNYQGSEAVVVFKIRCIQTLH